MRERKREREREREKDSSNFSLCVYKRASARTCVYILVFGPTTSLVKGSQQRQKQRAVRPRSVLSPWSSAIRVCKDSPFAFEVDWNVDVRTRVCTRECVRNNKVVEEDEEEEEEEIERRIGCGLRPKERNACHGK